MVTGAEFLRKVHRLGRERGVIVRWLPERGRGSHGTLYFGGKHTVVQHPARELKKGTFHSMLKQLGLAREDLG